MSQYRYLQILTNLYIFIVAENGDKTIVRCQDGDTYSKESGLAIAIMKYMSGNKGRFNDIFKKWIPESKEKNK